MHCRFVYGLGLALFVISSCKTPNPSALGDTGAQNSVVGVFDSQNQMIIPIPGDLEDPPTTGSSRARPPKQQRPRGLGLADAPTNTNLFESIAAACFSRSYSSITSGQKNWYFWAEIRDAEQGDTRISESEVPIENCGDIQLSLVKLSKDKKYIVQAKIYHLSGGDSYKSADQVTVWYQGESPAFVPDESGTELKLAKVLLDQKVNVIVEKSREESCRDRGRVWNGKRCLDSEVRMRFWITDKTDYVRGLRERKCLDFEGKKTILKQCGEGENQTLALRFRGESPTGFSQDEKENVRRYKYGWFQIRVGEDGSKCLTRPGSSKSGKDSLSLSNCDGDEHPSQLFSLVASTPSDGGGRDTYRVVSIYGSKKCVGINYTGGLQRVHFNDGKEVSLQDCDVNPELRRTQFVQFVSPSTEP